MIDESLKEQRKRDYEKKWRAEHPGYYAERSKAYREKFLATHVCKCLACGRTFNGYRKSYCSDECMKSSLRLAADLRKQTRFMAEVKARAAKTQKFQDLLKYVSSSGLKEILAKIPRYEDVDFRYLQSYIKRHNLSGYLKSIPRDIA